MPMCEPFDVAIGSHTPESAFNQATNYITSIGGQIMGTAKNGRFSVPGTVFMDITGCYAKIIQPDNSIIYRITVESKPLLVSCQTIEHKTTEAWKGMIKS